MQFQETEKPPASPAALHNWDQIASAKLADDFNAHRASRAANRLRRSFDRGRVHVRHLLGGDGENLLLRDLALLLLVRSARALLDARSLQQQHRSRRRLGDEAERTVSVHADDDWHGETGQRRILARALIELLAELHDVDLRLAKRGA